MKFNYFVSMVVIFISIQSMADFCIRNSLSSSLTCNKKIEINSANAELISTHIFGKSGKVKISKYVDDLGVEQKYFEGEEMKCTDLEVSGKTKIVNLKDGVDHSNLCEKLEEAE